MKRLPKARPRKPVCAEVRGSRSRPERREATASEGVVCWKYQDVEVAFEAQVREAVVQDETVELLGQALDGMEAGQVAIAPHNDGNTREFGGQRDGLVAGHSSGPGAGRCRC